MLLSVTRRLGALLAGLLLTTALHAQKAPVAPIRFGSVGPADFAAAPADTAAAEYLCDFGTTKIIGAHDHFQVVFERTARLRIHRKAGYPYATVQVPLYTDGSNAERLSNLKGFTYNYQNGRVSQVKLNPDPLFREKTDKNHLQVSFTMPDVREGSIIEFSYTITSDFIFNLQDWQFEHVIPTRLSEYYVTIPQFYTYKTITRGYQPFAVQESKAVPYSTSYSYSDDRTIAAPSTDTRITGQALQLHWALKDVPAFRPEAFVAAPYDYMRSVHFELAGVDFTGKNYKDVSGKWKAIHDLLQDEDNFGKALRTHAPLAAEANALAQRHPTDRAARAEAVRQLVQRTVRYDGTPALLASQPLRRTVERHLGNAADVNLLLVQTLREAGLPAMPLVLSTRAHGQLPQGSPVASHFNYVVAHLPLASGPALLLDATEPQLPPGLLPERCLNGAGVLVDTAGTRVSLAPAARHVEFRTAQLRLTDQGALEGQLRLQYSGYAGVEQRRQMQQSSVGSYLAGLRQHWAEWQPGPPQLLSPPDSVQQTLTVEVPLHRPLEADDPQVQLLYLPLMQAFEAVPHPFRAEERLYPVNMAMPHEYTTLILLTLPPGATVQEQPADLALAMPQGAGRFYCQITRPTPSQVQLMVRLQLLKADYSPAEYAALRELHQKAAAKCAEMLVVRRK